MHIQEMLRTHPVKPRIDTGAIAMFITAASDCAQACVACADACLAEEMRNQLVRCIRLNEDCADLCTTTARIVSRQTEASPMLIRSLVQVLATACKMCGEECSRHADMHEHCRVCAEACRSCEEACKSLIDNLPATSPTAAH